MLPSNSTRTIIRHIGATQLNARALPLQLRMLGQHLAIEQERNVGVELLLHLVQPLVRAIPRPVLVHHQQHLVRVLIQGEHVDHRRIGDAGRHLLVASS